MRHREFRKAPDLPADEIAKVRPLLMTLTRSAYWKFQRVWDKAGMEVGDLFSYALVWYHNYALHTRPTPIQQQQFDKSYEPRQLAVAMRQRFAQLAVRVRNKSRSTHPSTHLWWGETDQEEISVEETPQPSLKKIPRPKLDFSPANHNQTVLRLMHVCDATNGDGMPLYPEDVRRSAKMTMNKHAKTCAVCSAKEIDQRGNEDVTGANP